MQHFLNNNSKFFEVTWIEPQLVEFTVGAGWSGEISFEDCLKDHIDHDTLHVLVKYCICERNKLKPKEYREKYKLEEVPHLLTLSGSMKELLNQNYADFSDVSSNESDSTNKDKTRPKQTDTAEYVEFRGPQGDFEFNLIVFHDILQLSI